jgi:hypothetical protein
MEFDEPDVSIRMADIPGSLYTGKDPDKVYYRFDLDEFLLHFPATARYRVIKGREILVQPFAGSDPSAYRIYILTITMAAALMQQQKILLHASAILHNGGLMLFLGDSGAGKSSLVAELCRRGYRFFSDDVCVLDDHSPEDPEVRAFASYPMMKLWQTTVDALDDALYNTSHRIWPDTEKYGQFFHHEFMTKSYPVKKIFVLNPVHSGSEIRYSSDPVTGVEAFHWLTQHTYRKQFIHEISLQANHLKAIGRVVQQVSIGKLSRSHEASDISSFADFAECQFREE